MDDLKHILKATAFIAIFSAIWLSVLIVFEVYLVKGQCEHQSVTHNCCK